MDLGLKDKVFLVTGGTKGLGRATASALVDEGAHVVLCSRDPESVTSAVRALGGPGIAVGTAGDLADTATADHLVHLAHATFGRLDGAFVSVGGPPGGTATTTTDEQWRTSFESVFLGAVRLARITAAALTSGGSIAFVLSSSVKSPIDGLAASNGLRPGLAMVAKSLADELGPVGVRVNGLMPGRLSTDRLVSLDAATGDATASRARHEAAIPLRRYGAPEEFGRVAAFLLSSAASYITGTMIAVDGGALRSL
jgi:3-oxoacyl-[acyl-carrier protein] reductase